MLVLVNVGSNAVEVMALVDAAVGAKENVPLVEISRELVLVMAVPVDEGGDEAGVVRPAGVEKNDLIRSRQRKVAKLDVSTEMGGELL